MYGQRMYRVRKTRVNTQKRMTFDDLRIRRVED
jgi:hypothetical protein